MVRRILPLFLLLGICAAFTSFSPADKIVGTWKETWGVGQDTDVNYHDIYIININIWNKVQISAPDRKTYKFQNISYENRRLKFELINTTGDYVMPYDLVLDKGGDKMVGKARSIKGKQVNIEWNRVR